MNSIRSVRLLRRLAWKMMQSVKCSGFLGLGNGSRVLEKGSSYVKSARLLGFCYLQINLTGQGSFHIYLRAFGTMDA